MNPRSHLRMVPARRRAIAALVLALGATLPIAVRAAAPSDEAETLIREGVRLRGLDQTPMALPLFEKAYEIWPSPRTAAQLGLCQLELRHFVQAEHSLAEALASPGHPWIAKNRSVLEQQLENARANIGELALSVSPSTANVSVNGKQVDRALLGAPLRLDKGSVTIDVRADGYQPAHELATIVAGERQQRSVALVRQALVVATVPVALEPRQSPPAGAPVPEPPAAATPADRTSPVRIGAWIGAGVAAGALVFGTAEAFNAASKRDAFNDHTSGGVPDCATARLSAACRPLKDAYDQALTLSVVGFAAAGALAVTSSVLFVLSSDHGELRENGAAARAWACLPELGGRAFTCSLRF